MSKKIRLHKRLVVTGSLITSLFFASANTSLAAHIKANAHIETLHTPEQKGYIATSDAQITKIARKMGLDPEEVRVELFAGKLSPELLKNDGIDVSQLREVTILA